MNYRHKQNFLNSITGELFVEEQFDANKYFNECFDKVSFQFDAKEERYKLVQRIVSENQNNYEKTSSQITDKLMDNYSVFINIGKYVSKIDNSVASIMNAEKTYSSLLQSLRKDVEEFTINFHHTNDRAVQHDNDHSQSECKPGYFDISNFNNQYLEQTDEDLNMETFLNPQKGTKRWLQEIPEMLKVYVDEKSYERAVEVVIQIRESDITQLDYNEKLKIDASYNYFIENLTLSMTKAIAIEEIQTLSSHLILLNCRHIAKESYLSWISKVIKSKTKSYLNSEDERFLSQSVESKVMIIVDTIISKLSLLLKEQQEFFEKYTEQIPAAESVNFEIEIMDWGRQEIKSLMQNISILFSSITTTNQLKQLLVFVTGIYAKANSNGVSWQFINDEQIIVNLKLALESIATICMKEKGSQYELKEYIVVLERAGLEKQNITFTSCSEIGNAFNSLFQLIIEFLNGFSIKSDVLFYLENYFFKEILANDIMSFISSKVNFASNCNLNVSAFSDSSGALPSTNQVLLNYAISLTSIKEALNLITEGDSVAKLKLKEFTNFLVEIHEKFLTELFRIKIEWHFAKSWNLSKDDYMQDSGAENVAPESCFISFYYLMSSLIKHLKERNCNSYIINTILLDSQFIVFLNTIQKVVELNKIYDTDLNFSKFGIRGLEFLITGVLFIRNAIQLLLGLDVNWNSDSRPTLENENPKHRGTIKSFLFLNEMLKGGISSAIQNSVSIITKKSELVDMLIKDLIKSFAKNRNMQPERFLKSIPKLNEDTINYIAQNKFELSKL